MGVSNISPTLLDHSAPGGVLGTSGPVKGFDSSFGGNTFSRSRLTPSMLWRHQLAIQTANPCYSKTSIIMIESSKGKRIEKTHHYRKDWPGSMINGRLPTFTHQPEQNFRLDQIWRPIRLLGSQAKLSRLVVRVAMNYGNKL